MSTPSLLSGTLLTSDNHHIAYYHYRHRHKRVVIIAHGFYNSKDAVVLKKLAIELSDTYDVISFDFRGHGESDGLFHWTSKENKDLMAVLDYLENKYTKVGLIAFSLGAAISINVVSKTDRIDSLVAISAPSEIEKIDYRFWELDCQNDVFYTFIGEGKIGKGVRLGPFWLKKTRPIDSAGKIKIPILYIHGEDDWVIKPWHSRALYEKTNSKRRLEIIKNGPHAEYLLRDYPNQLSKLIKDWFSQTQAG